MSDIRNKQDNRNAKTKKLQLHKETLKDLSINKRPGASPRGGRAFASNSTASEC